MKVQLLPSQCAVCGKLMLAGPIVMDLWGNPHCAKHREEYSACSACNRIVCSRLTGGGVTYPDGRIVCNLCRQTAVDTKQQAKPIVEGVARWLYERGVRFDGLVLRIDLGSAHQLRKALGDRSSPTGPGWGQVLGVIARTTEHRDGRPRRKVNGVTILSGLPRELFEGVVAHELGHAWLYLARLDNLESWAEEGFCNLLSYILHKERSTDEARHWVKALEMDPNPIYGEGFRRVRAMFKKHGFGEALNYAFRYRRFPPE